MANVLSNTVYPPALRRLSHASHVDGKGCVLRVHRRVWSKRQGRRLQMVQASGSESRISTEVSTSSRATRPDWEGKDLYELLGVDITASRGTIRRAFRLAARTCHPDIPGTGDEELFEALKGAAQLLADDARRRDYDASLLGAGGAAGADMLDSLERVRAAGERRQAGPRSDRDIMAAVLAEADFEAQQQRLEAQRQADLRVQQAKELARAIQEANVLRRRVAKVVLDGGPEGRDVHTRLVLTAQEAAEGGRHELAVPRDTTCSCLRSATSWFITHDPTATKVCGKCKGEGRTSVQSRVQIEVPAGAVDGDVIVLEGKGSEPFLKRVGRFGNIISEQGTRQGDLYVALVVLSDDDEGPVFV